MKLYATFPLAALLLASAAVRQPAVSDLTPAQRDALPQQIEAIIRNAGYPVVDIAPANAISALHQRAFRINGCASDAIAVVLHFREIALLHAAWARFASTLPSYKLSLHYGNGQWTEINRPAIIREQIRLQFAGYSGAAEQLVTLAFSVLDAPPGEEE